MIPMIQIYQQISSSELVIKIIHLLSIYFIQYTNSKEKIITFQMFQAELFNDNKFQCEMHPQQSMKLICFSENCPYKRRFICLSCLLEEKIDLNNIVTLQDFIRDPISILDKANEYSQLKRNNGDAFLKQIEEFEFMLQQVLSDIILQLNKLKVQVSGMMKNLQPILEQILKKLKIHEFQQQLTLVWKMDSYQGTKEFAQLEAQINNIVSSWKECCKQSTTQIFNKQAKLSSDLQQDLSMKMNDKLKLEKNLFDNLSQSLSGLFHQQTEIQPFIIKEISKGKKIKWDLLYQGTRDGLSCASYWQKCDQQSHLLIIITLKNGNIFGGYCPCQLVLKHTGGYYVVDNTNSSFVFQQNKQEIYKLKNKDNTTCCNRDYGPIFGAGHDFCVQCNFKQVSSDLGQSYDITGYYVQDKRSHLIGDKDTEIVEFQIYQQYILDCLRDHFFLYQYKKSNREIQKIYQGTIYNLLMNRYLNQYDKKQIYSSQTCFFFQRLYSLLRLLITNMFTHIYKQIFNDKKYQYEILPEQQIKSFSYSQGPYQTRFICQSCLQLQEIKELDNFTTPQNFIKYPISLLNQSNEYSLRKNNSFKAILKQIYELEAKQKQVQQIIQKELDNLKSCVTNLAYRQLERFRNSNNLQNFKFLSMTNGNLRKPCMIIQVILFRRFSTYQTDIPEFIDNKDFAYYIREREDGLTNSSYWQKCDQQSHLLTIITLENGNIFGGYSPCLVNSEQANWVSDPSNSSFIFQQNKKEIYKLKNSQQAIYCYKDNGPNFGSDLHISNDFQSLGSDLGSMYDITPYNVDNIKTHLVGDKDRKIVEFYLSFVDRISFIVENQKNFNP
ncbi:hypothetical protein pb186bvf_015313 [Paramecium bursaria]